MPRHHLPSQPPQARDRAIAMLLTPTKQGRAAVSSVERALLAAASNTYIRPFKHTPFQYPLEAEAATVR